MLGTGTSPMSIQGVLTVVLAGITLPCFNGMMVLYSCEVQMDKINLTIVEGNLDSYHAALRDLRCAGGISRNVRDGD